MAVDHHRAADAVPLAVGGVDDSAASTRYNHPDPFPGLAMAFTTVCPNCDARLSAPDTVRGKKVKCKKCGEPFVARPAPATEDDEDDLPRPRKKGKGRKKKSSGSPVLFIVLIAIGAVVLIGGGVAAYFLFIKEDKPKDNPVAKTDPPKGPAGKAADPAGVAATAGWVDFTVPEGRFQVRMPRQPGPPITQRQALPNGGMSEVKMYVVDLQAEAFITGFVQMPPAAAGAPPDAVLEGAVNGAAANAKGGRIKSRTTITYQGFPGREAVIEMPGKEGNLVMRVILAGDRMIMMIAGGNTATPETPRVRGFMESLKIN
jgi:hypothetical protein